VSSGALFIRWIGNCTIKTHIIFCITGTVNYTRPRPSSASQELGNRQDQHHLQNHKNWELDKTHTIFSITIRVKQTRHTYILTSKAHAATIPTTTTTTGTIITTNLRQFLSSFLFKFKPIRQLGKHTVHDKILFKVIETGKGLKIKAKSLKQTCRPSRDLPVYIFTQSNR